MGIPLFSGSLLRSVLTLGSGNLIGQAIVIATSPILTRLYSPEELGTLGIYLAVVVFLTTVCSGRYELALPLPKSTIQAINLCALCSIILVIFVVFLSLVGFVVSESRLGLPQDLGLAKYFWLIPLGVFAGGGYKILSFWMLRTKQFGCIATSRVFQDGTMVSMQCLLGVIVGGSAGLLGGHLLGVCSAFAILLYFFVDKFEQFSLPRLKYIQVCARRYIKFPQYTIWAEMIGVLGRQLPIFLIAALFSPTVAGFYLLAQRVGSAPVGLISDALGRVLMSEGPDYLRWKRIEELTTTSFVILVRLSIIPAAMLAFVLPSIFTFVFGPEWIVSGEFLRPLGIQLTAVFIFVPIISLIPTLGKQGVTPIFQAVLAFSTAVSFYCGSILSKDILACLYIYATLSGLVYTFFGFWVLKEAAADIRSLILLFVGEIVLAFIIILFINYTFDFLLAVLGPKSHLLILGWAATYLLVGALIVWRFVKYTVPEFSKLNSDMHRPQVR